MTLMTLVFTTLDSLQTLDPEELEYMGIRDYLEDLSMSY